MIIFYDVFRICWLTYLHVDHGRAMTPCEVLYVHIPNPQNHLTRWTNLTHFTDAETETQQG